MMRFSKREELNLLEKMLKGDLSNDLYFCAVFNQGLRALKLTTKDVAKAFHISEEPLQQYLQKKAVPHVLVRNSFVNFFKRRIKKQNAK